MAWCALRPSALARGVALLCALALGYVPGASAQSGPRVSAELRELAQSVRTSPGRIPKLAIKSGDDGELELPLEHTDVSADVVGPVARVDVVQRYHNPHDEPIEAVYKFPLPENSAVDAMEMHIGDRVIEAEIKKREQARKMYERAKERGHTAALLEQERPNIFTQSVANIAPGEDIEVKVR